jgi:hypothetical protein
MKYTNDLFDVNKVDSFLNSGHAFTVSQKVKQISLFGTLKTEDYTNCNLKSSKAQPHTT